jgi:hypothetical protein
MARYRLVDRSPKFIPIVLDAQIQPGRLARRPPARANWGHACQIQNSLHRWRQAVEKRLLLQPR